MLSQYSEAPPPAELTPADPRSRQNSEDDVLDRALRHLLSLQHDNGCWEGEMVWCTMILSQYVIVQRAVGRPVDSATRTGMLKYFQLSRTAEGVWGLHPESGGYVFFTTLAYVALRLLGLAPDDPMLEGCTRRTIRCMFRGG